MRELPEGWVWTTLGETFRWGSGGTPTKSAAEYYDGGIPWAVIGDLNDGLLSSTHASISEAGLENSSAKWVTPGAVLVAMYGSIGKLGVATIPLTTNQAIAHARPGLVPHSYLFWYLRSIRGDLAGLGKGGTQSNISQTVIKAVPFPLAPLPEQHRIVARIEALFARLDDGIDGLKRAEASVERYRASVLKAAIEGRLTARWRNENPPDETGEELLRRSLAERRKRWEQEQLAKFVDRGRKPPGNWKSKYKEPVAPDTRALPELPEGWCWATVDQMGDVGSGITKGGRKRVAARRPVPYLRVANVQRGGLDLTEIKTIPASENEIRRYSLRSGDVLFNEGGDRDKLGRGCVWRGEIQECLHQNHVFRVRPFLRDYSPDFLSHYGNSSGREWFFRRATQSVNLASINQTVLRSLPVPVPPVWEQEQIVARVAHELANVERTTMEMGNASAKAASLRQSVLKRAFEGRLVPQDPADETASVLLERIRAEREAGMAPAEARH